MLPWLEISFCVHDLFTLHYTHMGFNCWYWYCERFKIKSRPSKAKWHVKLYLKLCRQSKNYYKAKLRKQKSSVATSVKLKRKSRLYCFAVTVIERIPNILLRYKVKQCEEISFEWSEVILCLHLTLSRNAILVTITQMSEILRLDFELTFAELRRKFFVTHTATAAFTLDHTVTALKSWGISLSQEF